MSLHDTIIERLKTAFPDATITLTDTGGGDHWHLAIKSHLLSEMPRVRQHQAIYRPLNDLIHSNAIHALQIDVKD